MSRKKRARAHGEALPATARTSGPAAGASPGPEDTAAYPAVSKGGGGATESLGAAVPSRARQWLFRAVLVLVPFLALLLLELLLRAVGYGVPMTLTLRQDVGGEMRLQSNPHFTWLFFDPRVARLMPPFSLPVRNPAGTFRVFVLGSSAAQGDPEPAFGLARAARGAAARPVPRRRVRCRQRRGHRRQLAHGVRRRAGGGRPRAGPSRRLRGQQRGRRPVRRRHRAHVGRAGHPPRARLARRAAHAPRPARGGHRRRHRRPAGTTRGAGAVARHGDVPRAPGAPQRPRTRARLPQLRRRTSPTRWRWPRAGACRSC